PGSGEIATVRQVISQLQYLVTLEELDDFTFVEINGMKVADPHQAYFLLWEATTGGRVSLAQASQLLETDFSTPSPRTVACVILKFFNWPWELYSRLIVLAVANTIDMLERTLSNKSLITIRLAYTPLTIGKSGSLFGLANAALIIGKYSSLLNRFTRITFSGYTLSQPMTIIQPRLGGVPGNIVHPDSIQFASRKVAAVSGDSR
ncbi:hypothetical protein HOY82DRAFT_622981, partial [Tuber indicum]